MDHRFIDEHSVAERYLDQGLTPAQRAEFEAHLVDCQECTDRVLLAEMFHSRNGHKPFAETQPLRVRFVRLFTPWQLFLILAAAAMLLVLVTSGLLLWAGR
ncbi:MAG TPA: zf-HC2 domain-containing protein [Bryobacteraceae bacterium]|jgi:anti-sigma factor RsiW